MRGKDIKKRIKRWLEPSPDVMRVVRRGSDKASGYSPTKMFRNPNRRRRRIMRNPETLDYGFAIGTSPEYIIKEYAKEDRIILTDQVWNRINEDISRIERNCLEWLRKEIGHAREEGHGGDDELVGTIFVKKGSKGHRIIKDLIEDEEILRTGSGNIWEYCDDDLYKGIKYDNLIDINIKFFK